MGAAPGLVVALDPTAGTVTVRDGEGVVVLDVDADTLLVKLHGDQFLLYVALDRWGADAAFVAYPDPPRPPRVGPGSSPGWLSLRVP